MKLRHIDMGSCNDYILPTVDSDKRKTWYIKDTIDVHRMDGPAYVIKTTKYHTREWYSFDNLYSTRIRFWCVERDLDVLDLSEEELLMMWTEIL